MPARAIYGLPSRPSPKPLFGIADRFFEWDHDLPGPSLGGIQFIPSLGLMMAPDYQGGIHFRDPVTLKPVFSFTYPLSTANGVVGPCYVPSANKIHAPVYGNNGANYFFNNSLDPVSVDAGYMLFKGSIAFGMYHSCYCPINDRVYTTGYASNVIYQVDPWADTAAAATPGQITGLGGTSPMVVFCPLTGKLYSLSYTAHTVQRIDPIGLTIEASAGTGSAYDRLFWSDGMKKMILLNSGTSANFKTLDPLNSDAQASLGFGSNAESGTYIPSTGETLVVDIGGAALRFIDQAGANVASITVTGEGLKYAGWNPVTKTVWITDTNNRKLWVVDPVERVTLERAAFAKSAG